MMIKIAKIYEGVNGFQYMVDTLSDCDHGRYYGVFQVEDEKLYLLATFHKLGSARDYMQQCLEDRRPF